MPEETSLSLPDTIQSLFAENKGIYATDATKGTMSKRMTKASVDPTDENRRDFREVMLSTEGLSQYISGVILNDEIIRQNTKDGTSFAKFVESRGMVPGIKVDKKCWDMANYPGEKIVEGLDGLRDRLKEYKDMGARFTKWRFVVTIGTDTPTRECIDSNAHATARYAALVQEMGMVPIVEPEVLMEGGHDMERCAQTTTLTLKSVFYHLNEQKVDVKGVILKTNMALPGSESSEEPKASEVAEKTVEMFERSTPKDLPGIAFLSGGQEAVDASVRLNEINKIDSPWKMGFSFERALEGPALDEWKGEEENIKTAQVTILKRAKLNSLARQGKYEDKMEKE
jgi:fructose-bisphosphate aldolase class I